MMTNDITAKQLEVIRAASRGVYFDWPSEDVNRTGPPERAVFPIDAIPTLRALAWQRALLLRYIDGLERLHNAAFSQLPIIPPPPIIHPHHISTGGACVTDCPACALLKMGV